MSKGLLCFVHTGNLGTGRNSCDLTPKSRAQLDFLALQLKGLVAAMPLNLIRVSCPTDLAGIQTARHIRNMMKGAMRGKSEVRVAVGERGSDAPIRLEELDSNVAKRFFMMSCKMSMHTMLWILEGHCDSIEYFNMMFEMLDHNNMGKYGLLDIIVGGSELFLFIIQMMKKGIDYHDLPKSFGIGEAIAIQEDRTWMKLSTDELKAGFK